MDNIILVASLILNALLGLKPVIMFVVKRTKTPKDDLIAEKVFKLIDRMSDSAKQKLLDKIK